VLADRFGPPWVQGVQGLAEHLEPIRQHVISERAGDGIRTRDFQLGKVDVEEDDVSSV
jgi:hypothetical protein